MSADPRYPLGQPVNRKASPELRPIAGRPHWFRDAHDIEHYIEPGTTPAEPAPPVATDAGSP